ncbi:hypothetical protein [Candidatus Hodarchaeum mangrovi]
MREPDRSNKRFLDSILNLLPNFVQKYPKDDQILLNDFIAVLSFYEVDTKLQRENLIQKINDFSKNYRYTELYRSTPFLWFAVGYFETSGQLLEEEKFYASRFYQYLVSSLRSKGNEKGGFDLLRQITPLTDGSWEELQRKSIKIIIPLDSDQLAVLKAGYNGCKYLGINLLYQNRLGKLIASQIKGYSRRTDQRRFFKPLTSLWLLQYHLPAFGLERINFQMKLENGVSLNQIINFKDPKSTLLQMSRIYRSRTNSKDYFGTLITMKEEVNELKDFLLDKYNLNLIEFNPIKQVFWSASLSEYEINKGWKTLTENKEILIMKRLSTSKPRKRRKQSTAFLSTIFNINAQLDHLKTFTDYVKVFCTYFGPYEYDTLPLESSIHKEELEILKTLYDEKILSIWFMVNRLRIDYSPDEFILILPLMSTQQLTWLLDLLPYAQIGRTDQSCIITTVLNPQMKALVEQLIQDYRVKWEIFSVLPEHSPVPPQFDWFNPTGRKWKPPLLK